MFQLGFKVIISGQDAERGGHVGEGKQAGTAASSLQGQVCLCISGAYRVCCARYLTRLDILFAWQFWSK